MTKTFEDLGPQIVQAIMNEARGFFGHEDLADDFSISVDGIFLRFGTKNRLCWSPSVGFSIDPTRCTPTFMKFNEHKSALRSPQ